MCENLEKLKKGSLMISSLCIFNNIKEDQVIIKYEELLDYLTGEYFKIDEAVSRYNDFVHELLIRNNGLSFKRYIIEKVLGDNNAFTMMIDKNDSTNEYILNQVKYEFKVLEYIASIKSSEIKECILFKSRAVDFENILIKNLIDWESEQFENYNSYKPVKFVDQLKVSILNCDRWENQLDNIIEFYRQYGTGIFGEYRAFVWENDDKEGYLRGIEYPDPIKLTSLPGYEEQKKVIIDNTKQFLKGYNANNILLYGQRGTGKSSTVKAIINEFYTEGLRLIEVDKDKLVDFTKIIRILKNKNLKFIIFVDDLAFEDGDESYSALKTILEGGVENTSNNMLIYATTNRKHLIKETFSERGDEVHAMDSVEEKLSLSDRFGITVSFYSPNQKEYLSIVDKIADERNIRIDRDYLHTEALKWTRWNNAISPRTAKQFVNWIEGESNQ